MKLNFAKSIFYRDLSDKPTQKILAHEFLGYDFILTSIENINSEPILMSSYRLTPGAAFVAVDPIIT